MSQLLSTWRGWLFAIFAAALLTACDPIASILLPNVAEVGVEVEFKSELLSQFKADQFQDLQYEWVFGDGTKATGPVVKHAYAQPGDYEVVLNVSDASTRSWGQAYASKGTLKVVPFTGAMVPVSVRVYDNQGASIVGATVSVAGQSALTDEAGGAYVRPTQPVPSPVALVEKEGFITQSVLVPDAGAAERGVVVRLKPKGSPLTVSSIEQAQTVVIETNLSPKVALPAQAFVNTQGEAVTGEVTARIAQWDITNAADMRAFLGQARADGGNGQVVSLVSFGMMSIEFEQGGKKLQLAPGKKAEISMDLPITSEVDGREIKVGDKIPLWHFDEARGLWVNEGEGEVVASATSWTGLGVKALVGHFSSWNWDRVQGPPPKAVSREVRCAIPAEQGGLVSMGADDYCAVEIVQEMPNGQVLSATFAVPTQGKVYADFVTSAYVTLTGEALLAGRRGSASWQQVVDSEAATPLVIVLSQQLAVAAVQGGDVAVVGESPAVVSFKLPNDQYFEVRQDELKIMSKSPVDGSLSELPFKPYIELGYGTLAPDDDPSLLVYSYNLRGGGNAALGASFGTLSGQLVAQLPVDSNFTWDPLTGVGTPGKTTVYTAEISVTPQTYAGPTLVRVPGTLTFALWDEVGVRSPIADNSIVALSFVYVDGGWAEGATPWVPAQHPDFQLSKGEDPYHLAPTRFKPYFSLEYDCSRMGDYPVGLHSVIMQVKVTDPSTGISTVYRSKVFVGDFPRAPCT